MTELHHPDDAVQAQEANELGVDVYVGLRLDPRPGAARPPSRPARHDESPGGRRLAELVQAGRPRALGVADGGVRGMSVPVLRETRMPAVMVEVGPGQHRGRAGARPGRRPVAPRSAAGPTPPGTDYR